MPALHLIECRTTFPAVVGEGEFILVFRKNSHIAQAERHARINGEFAAPTGQRPAAHFKVVPASAVAGQGTRSYRLEYQG